MIIDVKIDAEELLALSCAPLETFFSELVRCSRQGFHIVILPRQLAGWASKNLPVSRQDSTHLDKLKQEFTQLGGLRSVPDATILQIIADQQALIQIDERIWSIGILEALESNVLEKPVLLLENATNDGRLYSEIFILESKRRRGMNLSYTFCNGGGATTFQELDRLTDEQKIVVCVCDHDRVAPGTASSETLRKTKEVADKKVFVGKVFETPCRELENFLPLDIMWEMYGNINSNSCKKLSKLIEEQGELVRGDCLWLYFDCKNGVKANKLKEKCKSPDAKTWVENKFQVKDLDCSDIEFPGFGGNTVELFMLNGKYRRQFHNFVRSSYWAHHFASWFDSLFPFFWGRQRSRI